MPLYFYFLQFLLSSIKHHLDVSVFFFNLSVWDRLSSQHHAWVLLWALRICSFRFSLFLLTPICGGWGVGPSLTARWELKVRVPILPPLTLKLVKVLLITEWVFFFPTTSPLTPLQPESAEISLLFPRRTLVEFQIQRQSFQWTPRIDLL